jgi:alpha-tubulin suppressor-like RCC1 family protein
VIYYHKSQKGFALPTILIASVIMLTVLISAVSSVASINSSLDQQYYSQLAREAADSGIARANSCLSENAYVPQWTVKPLRPNTSCSGGDACTNTASCFVHSQGNVRTTFSVDPPQDQTVSQLVTAVGKVELLRSTNGGVWRTFTVTTSARVGIDLNLNTVAFGYAGGYGAYFLTTAADGTLRGVGFNGWGQLGNGSYADTLTPTIFKLNNDDRPISVFTNFVSGGYALMVLTDKGTVYGAGFNGNGQLGDGTTSTRNIATPFIFPAGVNGKFAALGGFTSYVLADNNRIYASGACGSGALGYNYTIAGCADISTPVAVALPTPTSDTNTIPTTNIVTDYKSAIVRMQGGRVYGWGYNADGELADGTTTDSALPKQIGTYGNTGLPKASQVVFDGVSTYILDDSGAISGTGSNSYGQLGAEKINIGHNSTGKCLDNAGQDGLTVQVYTCNTSVAQEWTFRSDGSIYLPNKDKCLDNKSQDGVTVQLYTCNNSVAQQFVLRDDSTIYLPTKNVCLNNPSAATMNFAACTTSTAQKFNLRDSSHLLNFALPPSAGTPIKMATDQWFTSVLTNTGEVWSAGANNNGQLGDGSASLYQPYPVKFILPAGVTATDVFVSAYLTTTSPDYDNVFVVGSDGKVYGAGSNTFGQLGDGTTTNRSTPVAMQVINGTTIKAKQVQSGYGTTVILTESNKIYTVGNNGNGQLGDGTTTNSSVPKANRYTNVLPVTNF